MADQLNVEYTQDACDVWQIAHVCNYMAEHGWDVVTIVPSHPNVKVPVHASDPNGPLRDGALLPYVILFRRPIPTEADESA